jgi:hypothetical protein
MVKMFLLREYAFFQGCAWNQSNLFCSDISVIQLGLIVWQLRVSWI